MADFDVFGPAASGARLVDLDRINAAEKFGNMSLIPYKAEELRTQAEMQGAHAAMYRAQARGHEQKVMQEEQFAQLIRQAQGQTDQQTNVLDRLDGFATQAAGAGMVNKATEILGKTSTIRMHNASQAASLARAEDQLLQSRKRRVDALTSLMSDGEGNLNVQTAEDWATVNQLYAVRTGEPSPWAGVPFAAVPGLFNSAMTVKEQTDEAVKRAGQDATTRYRSSRLSQIDAQQAVREARQRLAEEREERLSKDGGGKAVSGPSSEERRQAARLIKQADLGVKGDDLEEAAYAVAAQARVLRSKNRALGSDTAINQAFQEMKDQFVDSRVDLFGWRVPSTGSVKLDRQGRTPELAMPLPGEQKDLKVGRFYRNAQGQIARWDGKKLILATPPALRGNNRGAAPAPADEEDDGED